jgi:hypothetical protein
MENKIIYNKEFKNKIKDLVIKDEEVIIEFEDGGVLLESYHNQDCCENVYADFSIMKYYKERLVDKELKDLTIKSVKDMGFLLCFNCGYDNEKVFIPCYNSQNGYYSSDLELHITEGEVTTKIDISDLVEDDID